MFTNIDSKALHFFFWSNIDRNTFIDIFLDDRTFFKKFPLKEARNKAMEKVHWLAKGPPKACFADSTKSNVFVTVQFW